MTAFSVTTEQFSGPIDILLRMIEKRKMPINDVSLASITDDYIHFLQNIEKNSLSDQTHFILVASTLTLIKSKSILPTIDLTDDEESDIDALKKRLEIFSLYQHSSKHIKQKFTPEGIRFYSQTAKRQISFQPHSSIEKNKLQQALQEVFASVPQVEKKDSEKAYIRVAIHIEEMMDSLTERIQKTFSGDFSEFIKTYTGTVTEARDKKVYNAVGFLAMLELIKKGTLHVLQEHNFSNIRLEKS